MSLARDKRLPPRHIPNLHTVPDVIVAVTAQQLSERGGRRPSPSGSSASPFWNGTDLPKLRQSNSVHIACQQASFGSKVAFPGAAAFPSCRQSVTPDGYWSATYPFQIVHCSRDGSKKAARPELAGLTF